MRGRRRQNELRSSIFLGTKRADPDRPPAGKNRPLMEVLAAFGARTIDDDIDDAEAMARRALADEGLPTKLGWYVKRHDGGFEPSPMPKVKSFADAFHAEAKSLIRWSGPWLSFTRDAVMVLLAASSLRRDLAAGVEPRKLAREAMVLGQRREALSVSRADVWQLADAGQRAREGASLGGRSRDAMTERHRQAQDDALGRADALRAAGLRVNKSAIARSVAKDHGVSPATVQHWLKPSRPSQKMLVSNAPSPQK